MERWENEGGHWPRIHNGKDMSDHEHWGTNEFAVIPPFDKVQGPEVPERGTTPLNSTHFMKLWTARMRIRNSAFSLGPGSILRIRGARLPDTPSAE